MPNSLETGWTPARVIAVAVAALSALVTILTTVGTFLTDYINADWAAPILAITATLSAILPRVQWVTSIFGGK